METAADGKVGFVWAAAAAVSAAVAVVVSVDAPVAGPSVFAAVLIVITAVGSAPPNFVATAKKLVAAA